MKAILTSAQLDTETTLTALILAWRKCYPPASSNSMNSATVAKIAKKLDPIDSRLGHESEFLDLMNGKSRGKSAVRGLEESHR
jgi:hypothetical protein